MMLVCAFAVGCKGQGESQPSNACRAGAIAVADAMADPLRSTMDRLPGDHDFARLTGALADQVARVCAADGWPAPVLTCLESKTTAAGMHDCVSTLTAAQLGHLNDAFKSAVGRLYRR
jgi:hypothetical protein